VRKPVQMPIEAAGAVPAFDLDDPHLPRETDAGALTSAGVPYLRSLQRRSTNQLELLQIALIKLHASWH
jgi:hypothetical protein